MRHGFSLVELSIVLVILGLLTGGILAGQSLIRGAEIRSVSTEYSRYIAAAQTFRDKYFAIPGDMNNGTRFWGRQINQAWCVTNSAAAVATPGTCDGNGDGMINSAGAASQSAEIYQFWTQLAHAGLVEGSYSGLSGSGGTSHSVIGTNVPASRLGNAGWSMAYVTPTFAGDGNAYALDYSNHFRFGTAVATFPTHGAVLKPEEAWGIDSKMDDGLPASGTVIAYYWNNACAAANDGTHANTDFAASYKLTDSTVQCALYFRKLF